MDSTSNQNIETLKSFDHSIDSIEHFTNRPSQNQSTSVEIERTIYSNHDENDYEVIKKEDENISMNSFGAERSNIPLIDEVVPIEEPLSNNGNVSLNVIINESITFSLLNTKIAEESEIEDDEDERYKSKKDNDSIKPNFEQFKPELPNSDMKSISLREPNSENSKHFHNTSSLSYSSRSKV